MNGRSPSENSSSGDSERLTRQLAKLGAETPAQRRAKRILPWLFSAIIHVGVVLLAVLITWTVTKQPKKDESVLIVADFNAMNYESVAAPRSQQDAAPVSAPAAVDFAPAPPSSQEILDSIRGSEGGLPDLHAAGFPGVGNAGAAGAGLSQFAPKAGGNAASFAGVTGTNARKIVYAIDASGSMIAFLQIVIDELSRSLANLSPQQSYAVVFFQGDSAIEVPPAGRFTAASAIERDRTLKWIKENIVPRGGTNPLAALRAALKLKPDVVFLLSQDITGYGQFEVDQHELFTLLDRINPVDPTTGRRLTQINCIQFLDPDPLDTMRLIAQEHGGPNGYKFLSRQELGLSK